MQQVRTGVSETQPRAPAGNALCRTTVFYIPTITRNPPRAALSAARSCLKASPPLPTNYHTSNQLSALFKVLQLGGSSSSIIGIMQGTNWCCRDAAGGSLVGDVGAGHPWVILPQHRAAGCCWEQKPCAGGNLSLEGFLVAVDISPASRKPAVQGSRMV